MGLPARFRPARLARFLALGAISLAAASVAFADTKSWTGAVSNLWSVGGNWSDGVAPVDGDDLYFPYYGSVHHAMVNDLVGLTLQSASAPIGDFSVTGNAVALSAGLAGPLFWSLPTTLAASQTFQGVSLESVDLNGHTLTLDGLLIVTGSLVGSGALVVNGNLNLSGNSTFTGPLTVSPSSSLSIGGSIANSTLAVGSGGSLTGTGTLPATSLTNANLRPNDVLSTGNLSVQGGTVTSSLRLDFLGTHFDRFETTGVVLLTNPTLEVMVSAGLPLPGDSFVLIDNDGADPILGTFHGLPEGATLASGAVAFRISYTGGSGNDVTLTALPGGPKAWTGAINNLWSVGGNWGDGVAPVDGDDLYFPYYGAVHHAMVNDLVGLTLQSASGPQGDFSVTGNALALSGGLTGPFVWDVPTTLAAPQTFHVGANIGSIDLNGQTLTLDGGYSVTGALVGSGGLVVNGGLHVLGTSTFTGPLTISPGSVLSIFGSIANSTLTVGSGASLTGNGTVPATTLTNATLQPNDVLSTGNLSVQGGTVASSIRLDFLGAHVDRIETTGSVTLGNPTLQLAVTAGLPLPGESFLLIDNDGADPILGTFHGLPEGATLASGAVAFRISYVGGSGNDVALTALAGSPKAWTGAVNNLWSVGGNWNDGVAPVDGDALFFPYYGAVHHAMVNDLVALTLQSASAPQGDFSVTGNPVALSAGLTGPFGWTVPTTLAASQTFHAGANLGSVDLNGQTLTLDGSYGVSGSLVGSGALLVNGGLNLNGSSTFTGPFTVSPSSVLTLFGSIANSTLTVGSGGWLIGTGTVPGTTLSSATLVPYDLLSTGNLSLQGGTFTSSIRLDFLGTHVDRIQTTGTLTLANPTLQVTVTASLPPPGDSFILIDNDGADPILGIFSGLPEGATLIAGPVPFRISYIGGSGNDVTLTALIALATTTTTISSSVNPAAPGEPIVLTAHVSSSPGVPTGTVSFEEGITVLGTAILDSAGNAAITVQLAAGTHSIVARYGGASAFAPSVAGPLTQTVIQGGGSPAAIPTLGGLALALLAAGLAAIGARLASH